jgi:putative tryptophan/tyrosine transport system substrate-binding protein
MPLEPFNRRAFITLLGGAAATLLGSATATLARVVRAQQLESPRRIGLLSASPVSTLFGIYSGFVKGMRELGYVDGRDFVIEWRSAEGKYGQFSDVVAELVRLNVDVIVTGVTAGIRPLQQATTTIPIVMAYSTDPVRNGLVASLARPGGNTTGLAGSSDDTSPKQVELLATVVPNLSRIGLLGNPNSPTYSSVLKNAQDAAQKAGLSVLPIKARNPQETEDAFAALGKEHMEAIMVASDAVFFGQRQRLAELALRNRMPTMFSLREYAEAGGLMSYGENLADFFRRAASYVDKILRGAKPADIPIEQPTKFDLVINLTTAKALGLTIPESFLLRADEVID